jgi:hypothetical protein
MLRQFIMSVVVLLLKSVCTQRISEKCRSSLDLGQVECQSLDEYSTYQWASCVTTDYIEHLSSVRGQNHSCPGKTSTQCFYPCMREFHNINKGVILSPCNCSGPEAPLSDSLGSAFGCYSPEGDSCDWYKHCLHARYNCTKTGYEYANSYGKKFCDRFGKWYSEFGILTRSWIDEVRQCLQVKLVPYLRPWVMATCREIHKIAFGTHTGCYLSPAIGAPSVCQLPCGDLWKVFRLVSGALFSGPFETSRQMFQVAAGCLADQRQNITCLKWILKLVGN